MLCDNAHRTKILLNDQFFRDLTWFNVFLQQYNGVTFYDKFGERSWCSFPLRGLTPKISLRAVAA